MSQKEALMQRVAALETKFGMSGGTSRNSLVAEIESLEKRLTGCGMGMGEDEPLAPVTVADEPTIEDLEQQLGMGDDEEEVPVMASLADPNGIEEQITQDRFTEVEGERHGEELASAGSMLEVGEESPTKPTGTGYVARLMTASARLDRVAEYLEKCGRRNLAFKVDRIADAVDARINTIKGRK